MKKLKSFLSTSVLGGLTVLLPGAVTIIVFSWIFDRISGIIAPLTTPVYRLLGEGDLAFYSAQALVIVFIVLLCFMTGLIQMTKLGRILFEFIERALGKLPGYVMVKEIIAQFTGGKRSPFSSVVLVRIFDSDVWCTGFVTDEHPGDFVTVFVPTGPNPTTGGIFHLSRERIRPVQVPVESAMRSIISCGSGSKTIVHRGLRQGR
jgi:uncharacterized membrane protein